MMIEIMNVLKMVSLIKAHLMGDIVRLLKIFEKVRNERYFVKLLDAEAV
jgi:hypothetical protein